jgi:hypothetical protein
VRPARIASRAVSAAERFTVISSSSDVFDACYR